MLRVRSGRRAGSSPRSGVCADVAVSLYLFANPAVLAVVLVEMRGLLARVFLAVTGLGTAALTVCLRSTPGAVTA